MRAFGVLFFCLVSACASTPDGGSQMRSQPRGPECGHGALDSDAHNCGECGHDCTQLPGVDATSVTCVQGACDFTNACQPGLAHCSSNPDDGCEADLSSPSSCGACGTTCDGGGTCVPTDSGGHACQSGGCTSGTACNGACVDLQSDSKNCGACGQACAAPANGSATCSAGACGVSCDSGFTLTNGACVAVVVNSWTPQTSGTTRALYAVWGSTAGDVFVAGDRGTILQAARGGAFADVSAGNNFSLDGVWGSDTTHVITVGSDTSSQEGAVLRTQTDGSFAGNGFANNAFAAVWGSAPGDIWAIGASGLIMHNTSGTKWSTASTGTTRNLWAVWGSAADDIYVVGDNGTILHYDGSDWTRQTSGVRLALTGVWGSSPSDIFVVGTSGEVLHSDGSGAWVEEMSNLTDDLNGVVGVGSDVWAVGANGAIGHRTAGTWAADTSGTTRSLWAIWGSASDGLFAVGDAGTILHR